MQIFKTLSKNQVKVWFVSIRRYKRLHKVELGTELCEKGKGYVHDEL